MKYKKLVWSKIVSCEDDDVLNAYAKTEIDSWADLKPEPGLVIDIDPDLLELEDKPIRSVFFKNLSVLNPK